MEKKTKSQAVMDINTILDQLTRVVEWANDFVLVFIKCNHLAQREALRRALHDRLRDKRMIEVFLEKPIVSLLDELTSRWNTTNPSDVVSVYGLENSINEQGEASALLGRLNHDRDLLRQAIPVPLLIWLPDFALDYIARGAPDFWAWRSGVYEFATDKALWQIESDIALNSSIPFMSFIFSMPFADKQKELARVEELLRTANTLSRRDKRAQETLAQLLLRSGAIYSSLGKYDQAKGRLEEALAIYRELNNQRYIALVFNTLGAISNNINRSDEALHYYQQALTIWDSLQDTKGQSEILLATASTYILQGQYEMALTLLKRSLVLSEQLRNPEIHTKIIIEMAEIHIKQAQYNRALDILEQALIRLEGSENDTKAKILLKMAVIYSRQERYNEALALYHQAFALFERFGDVMHQGVTSLFIGNVHAMQGRHNEALAYFKRALAIFEHVGLINGKDLAAKSIEFLAHV